MAATESRGRARGRRCTKKAARCLERTSPQLGLVAGASARPPVSGGVSELGACRDALREVRQRTVRLVLYTSPRVSR